MSQEVMAQLSVHRSLSSTAKVLKEMRIDRPFPPNFLLRLQLSLDFLFMGCEADRNQVGVIRYAGWDSSCGVIQDGRTRWDWSI